MDIVIIPLIIMEDKLTDDQLVEIILYVMGERAIEYEELNN